jgi:hypothetical protein
MPEKRSEKRDYNNAKDKAPRFEAEGLVVVRGHEVAAKPAQIAEAQRMAREWKRLGAPGRAALSARWTNVRLQGRVFCSAYGARWRSL